MATSASSSDRKERFFAQMLSLVRICLPAKESGRSLLAQKGPKEDGLLSAMFR